LEVLTDILPPIEGKQMATLKCEFIPASKKDSGRLLILLHGLGDSLAGFRWVPEALNLPWLNYLLVNAPDPYFGGFAWYDFTGDVTSGVNRSGELLIRLLKSQEAKGFAPEKTILGGFSQGCLMSLEVGLRYPRKLAGIIGISGYVCDPDKLLRELSPVARKQRVLMTHGTFDPIVPFLLVQDQVRQLKKAGLNIAWHELMKPHTIAGEPELKLIRDFIAASYNGAAS
jgi:phospholipase/carboxylesterase